MTCPSCQNPLEPGVHFCPNCGTPTPTEPGVPARTMPTGAIEVSRIRSALADRYKIERVLGEGGMATVYLAEDLKHRRKVAVKVMRPELAETLGSERFLREVEIAAKLSHPNILPVYDSGNASGVSGNANGVLYYVMPVIEGESLPARLKRDKQLPVEEALRLAREVAEALAYAHRQGFVHRDIKPANILLSDGHALVADFGIARATSGEERALTQTGLAIGTPQYMSPEQASGDPNVDGRTDIYALGCVLYEMLAGEPPFTGPTAQAIITRSITEMPRSLTSTRQSLAPAVESTVMRALAKSPADRFANASAMATALVAAEDQTRTGSGAVLAQQRGGFKAWQMVAAAAVVLLIGVLGWKAFANGGVTATKVRSVAVLPFENQGSADEAYFADGIVDELRDKLARLDGLTVIASASADQYRDSPKTGTQIADELNVDQVLTGKVRWGEGEGGVKRVRVTAELVDGKSGAVTWRNTFDADLTDALVLQGRIASDVAAALGTVLSPNVSNELAGQPTKNAEAYQLYLKARATTYNSISDVQRAATYYEQAVVLDPNFARAWAGLTDALSAMSGAGSPDPTLGKRARAALDQTLRLADDSAFSHLAASSFYSSVAFDSVAARLETVRAWAIDSSDIGVLIQSAKFDLEDENYQAMFDKYSRARELSPRSEYVLGNLLRAQVSLGFYDDAVTTARSIMEFKPTNLDRIQQVIFAYLAVGDTAAVRRVIDEVRTRIPVVDLVAFFAGYQELGYLLDDQERELLFRMSPAAFDNDRAWWGQALAIAAHQQGDMARARAYADSSLAESKQQAATRPNDYQLATLYGTMLAYTGHKDEAIREVERGLAIAHRNGAESDISYASVQAMRVYREVGKPEKALDILEELRKIRSSYSPGLLKIDPLYKPFKGNPRFERLANGGIQQPVD